PLILAFGSFFNAHALSEMPTMVNTQSIQQAVNAAQEGSVIIVPAGSYPESVRVSKNNITIRCSQPYKCSAQRFEVWGSNNTLEGFVITGGKTYGLDVRQHNNTFRNIEISGILYDFGLPRGQGDANGVILFGTGHVFDKIYIHDIDQYHVDDLGYPEPHQDCFQTWSVPARGGAASRITITNTICDMPQSGDSFTSKMLQSSGGSHDWTVRNVVSIAPMMCLFYDEAYNIDISYSTFIGAGIDKPGGCKFLKLTNAPPPHDNKISYSVFQNITGTPPLYDYVSGSNNCFWQTTSRSPDPGDVYANPLLLPDYSLAVGSPCARMGAYQSSPSAELTPPTPTGTSTSIPVTITPSPTQTNSFLPAGTQTAIPWTATPSEIIATATDVTPTPLPQTPIITPTFTVNPPALPSGTSVLTSVDADTLLVGQTGLVSVSLNGLPSEGIASVEFTCSYASDQISVGSVQIGQIFGDDPVSAYNNSQAGSFIYAVAASNGKVINTNGVAFTFNITGLQPGSSFVECKAKISRTNYSLESIASVPDSITVALFSPPTATPLSAPMLTGQVIAIKPVKISLFNPDTTLAATAMTNPDGTFNLIAPPGSFTVVASAEGHLSAQTSVTLLEGTTTTLDPVSLLAGDIDNNNVIDQYDALTVGMNYNLSASIPADLSNDGLINVTDLEMLAENYRMAGFLTWQQP
ncbi:hypothetical protein FBQ87_14790, partial [Sphingobacteriales bacterium CHB3]|nr:hypothetical protein [Sphingobacteriales bacterium CHB3]